MGSIPICPPGREASALKTYLPGPWLGGNNIALRKNGLKGPLLGSVGVEVPAPIIFKLNPQIQRDKIMKKTTLLRRRAQEMTEHGEHSIAAKMIEKANTLEGRATPRVRRMAPSPTPQVDTLPDEILVFQKGDRMFIQPPALVNDKGNIHWGKCKAFAASLRDAATIDNKRHYKYEGRSFKPDDPRRSQWSFTASVQILNKIKQVLGNFFSEATLINENGEVLGTLPKSTYQGTS